MISIFGITSIFIAIISIAVIILHNRIMKRRTPVDIYMAELEELVRQRMEMLYKISTPGTDLNQLCANYIDLDFNAILDVLPDINDAFNISEEKHTTDTTALDENADIINKTTDTLNQAIKYYNDYISKSPTEIAMAKILGLEEVEPVI